MPAKILQVDITENFAPIPVDTNYSAAYILTRYQKTPLGWIYRSNKDGATLSAEEVQERARQQFGWKLIQLGIREKLSFATSSTHSVEPISVVVCTRNRTHYLAACLQALTALEYPEYEIVIVDNAPSNDDTYRLAQQYPVRYVREDRPGLNWARNRGIAEAKHNIIAFTDDDALADPYWLEVIGKSFLAEEVMCVTGNVAPAELDTAAQEIFEFGYGGMGHGMERLTYHRIRLSDRQLLWANRFGVGANMAFRRSVFESIGMFDVALDVGTPSSGAGDLDMFHRVVASGHLLVYEPCMLVWHRHRSGYAALQKQIRDNGRGFGCFLIKCLREGRVSRLAVLQFFFMDWLFKWSLRHLIKPRKMLPRPLLLTELAGMLQSPFAYRATKAWSRKIQAGN